MRPKWPGSPEQMYAGLAGAFLLMFGSLFVLFAGVDFDRVGLASDEPRYAWWRVSGWMAVLWIAVGALGLLSAPRQARARRFALAAGVLFTALAIAALAEEQSVAGVLVAGTDNTATYGVLAALGLWIGTLPREPRQGVPAAPATRERRFDRTRRRERVSS